MSPLLSKPRWHFEGQMTHAPEVCAAGHHTYGEIAKLEVRYLLKYLPLDVVRTDKDGKKTKDFLPGRMEAVWERVRTCTSCGHEEREPVT